MQTTTQTNALQTTGRVPAVQGVLHPAPSGNECFNCATPLLGHWCHRCGQHAEDYHRSTRVLFWEAMEHMFSTDGRVWHTLPRLLTRPGTLTREYLAGKRVRQVPPLRLFFVVLIILFLVGGLVSRSHHVDLVHFNKPGDMAEAEKTISQMNVQLFGPVNATLTRWARTRLGAAVEHPDELGAAMGEWAHDFAFMTLPISALILSAMFMFRRRYVLFDHLIFTMHSMSFQGMLVTLVLTLRGPHGRRHRLPVMAGAGASVRAHARRLPDQHHRNLAAHGSPFSGLLVCLRADDGGVGGGGVGFVAVAGVKDSTFLLKQRSKKLFDCRRASG